MESTSHESLILACGNNSEGQSGIAGGEEETIRLPLPLTKTADLQYDKVIAVCSSLRQSFAVTSDYLLLSCGENDANQLARSGKRSTLLHIDMLSKYRIRDVAAGNGFFHACTVDGRVISWGKNDLGQLGDGGRESREKPKLNSNFTESILQIVCGESHCIALTNGGNVLTFGGNRKGQLGDGQLTSSCVPRISPALRHRPIIGICTGANHCLAFTVTGNLYVWGDNAHGQLGLGDTTLRAYPTLVRSLRSARVCGVSAGQSHSAAISPNGLLFTWGSNAHGQLGLGEGSGEVKASLVPMVVEKLREKFTMQVCCGAHHTLAVCRGGAGEDVDRKIVYAMGLNASGQLGIGSKASNAWLPTALSLPSSFLLQSVASGCLALHSFLFSRGVPLRRSTLPRIDLQFLAAACARLKSSKNDPSALQTLRENVVTVFSSISCVNASFLKREESLCHDVVSSPHSFSASVDLPSVREAYNLLTLTGDESVMATLGRATLHLTDQLKECPYDDLENLNCFLIVLENPLLLNPHLFHIGIERVITGILALPSSYRSTLFNWLRSYESQYFQRIVTVMQSYLSYALQNTRLRLDPSPVTLVLNSLFECNHSTAGSIVPDDAFYNAALEESVDLIADCEAYLSEKREKLNSVVFRFCRFPFLLPLSAKNRILQHELTFQKTQVLSSFAMAVIHKKLEQMPKFLGIARLPDGTLDLGSMHLALNVRRHRMLLDVLKQIGEIILDKNLRALQLPLRVTFVGEEAVDYGGVRKELFNLCISQFIRNMKRCGDGTLVWFSDFTPFDDVKPPEDLEERRELEEYIEELKTTKNSSFYLGVLVSLACYNGVLVDLPLPSCVFKILRNAPLQICDLFEADAGLANGLQTLLDFEGESDSMRAILGVTFSVSSNPLLNNALSAPSRLSDIKYVDLVPNGDEVYVDHSNKHQFVDLFVQHALHKSCEEHINKFILGLRITEVTENAMTLCSAREVEGIICGKKELTDDDISVLRLHTTYKGVFHDEHPVIHWFWEVLSALSVSLKYKFLEFVTGSDRLPIGGISKVGLIIQSTEQDCNALPSSHTCFNILELPRSYVSADQLRSKLVLALEYSRGFGFA